MDDHAKWIIKYTNIRIFQSFSSTSIFHRIYIYSPCLMKILIESVWRFIIVWHLCICLACHYNLADFVKE